MFDKSEIIKICREKDTIPLEKLKFNAFEYKKATNKSREWVDNYFERSKWEDLNPEIFKKEVTDFISDKYDGDIIFDFRCGESMCDIYLPELKKAFKFLPLFEYSEINFYKKNQLKSYTDFEKEEIHLIQIFEDSWNLKKELVKNRIINTIGLSNKIWARKCEVRVVTDNKLVKDFIINSHTQGYIGSSVKLGLYHNDELVSLMTFGSLRKNLGQSGKEGSYELLRFCNKFGINVVGGASKLFNHFLKVYKPSCVISYADKCWSYSPNCLYTKIGMTRVHDSDPSYFYIIGTKRKGRYGYRKDVVLQAGFDGDFVGEHTGMLSMGIYRIFDVGTSKFVYQSNY
jgi:hypothetical protein